MGKRGFRGLKVWQRAKCLAVDVYAAVKRSPELTKDLGLRDQMQRAAVGVCSNIAEGDERDADKDAVRFFYIAKGSVAKLITQLKIAKDAQLLDPPARRAHQRSRRDQRHAWGIDQSARLTLSPCRIPAA